MGVWVLVTKPFPTQTVDNMSPEAASVQTCAAATLDVLTHRFVGNLHAILESQDPHISRHYALITSVTKARGCLGCLRNSKKFRIAGSREQA